MQSDSIQFHSGRKRNDVPASVTDPKGQGTRSAHAKRVGEMVGKYAAVEQGLPWAIGNGISPRLIVPPEN